MNLISWQFKIIDLHPSVCDYQLAVHVLHDVGLALRSLDCLGCLPFCVPELQALLCLQQELAPTYRDHFIVCVISLGFLLHQTLKIGVQQQKRRLLLYQQEIIDWRD